MHPDNMPRPHAPEDSEVDIVERLQSVAGLTVESPAPHLSGDMKFYVHGQSTRDALTGAIAEIERLRAEVADMSRTIAQDHEATLLRDRALKIASEKCVAAESQLAELRRRVAEAPVAIMDTRDALGICAPTDDDFPALYALQGKRVRLLPLPPPPTSEVVG